MHLTRSETRSKKLSKLPGILGIVCQGLTLAFLIIRLFAIYDKKAWILYVTVPSALINIALSSFALADADASPAFNLQTKFAGISLEEFSSSCLVAPSLNGDGHLLRYELSYIAIILFDTLVFFLSVAKMGRMYRAKRLFHPESIVNILLRDGIILYATLTFSNAFNFVALMLDIRAEDNPIKGLLKFNALLFEVSSGTNGELTHAMSAIFVSRMVFNLREAGTEIYEGTEEWRSRIERSTGDRDMQFRIPTSIHEDYDEIRDDLSENRGSEVSTSASEILA